jgi:uncharacterized membrane protein
MSDKKNALGVDQNLAGLLCYVLGFVSGIIFLALEKDNKFIKFHAMQSTIIFGGLFVLGLLPFGFFLNFFLGPIAFILWIILMVKAHKGEMFKLPIIGDLAEKQVNKMK